MTVRAVSSRQGGIHAVSVGGAALLWSTTIAVTKVILPDGGELTLGALRFLATAFLLLIVCLIGRQRLRAPLRTYVSAGAAGLVGITAYFALENYGVALATATDAVLIAAAYPVLMR